MLHRIAVLCGIEAVIAILLAIQLFAAPAPARLTAGAPSAAAPTAATVANAPLAPRAPLSPPTVDSDATQRLEAPSQWRPDDPIGVLLTGAVRHPDGTPADVSVRAGLDRTQLGTGTVTDGSFALPGLRPGEWTITLAGTEIVAATKQIRITDQAVQHHEFVVAPSFPVRVLVITPTGADATSELRKQLPGFGGFLLAGQRQRFPERLAASDHGAVFVGDAKWDGEMNPKNGFAGTLHLAAVPAHVALLQRHLVLDQQLVQAGQLEVKFVVDVDALRNLAGAVTLRVVDAGSGAPLAKARVSLMTSNRGGPGLPVDADGRAELTGLPPGLLRCQIQAPDHELMYSTVSVADGQRLDLGEVRLGPAVPLQGTVLDADGKPAAANLSWTELKWRHAPTGFATNRRAITEADGTFSLFGTGHGAIAVTARDRAGNLASTVFDHPSPTPLVLRLSRPGQCTITRPHDPTRGFTITIYDGSRRAIAARDLAAQPPSTTIELPTGDYTFEVHDDRFRVVQSGALTFGTTPCTLEVR